MIAPVQIERMDGGPSLVVHGADAMLRKFFDWDKLSRKYDHHAAAGADPNRVTHPDLTAVNTLGARSRESAWSALLGGGELDWLRAIPTSWRLFDIEDAVWEATVKHTVAGALDHLKGDYLGVAVATKMLHLKRPALFPIIDALVLDLVGGRGFTAMEITAHLRKVGLRSRDTLTQIARQVSKPEITYTEVRVLDAILWCVHPASSFAEHLQGRVDVTWTG